MLTLLVLIVAAAGAVAWGAGRRAPNVGIVAKSVLVMLAAWLAWSILVMGSIVQIEPVFRTLGVNHVELSWVPWILLGPPVLIGVAFGVVMMRRRQP